MRVLNVGCGHVRTDGAEHCDQYVDEPWIDYRCHSRDIPVADGSYDLIYGRHWLEHLDRDDARQTVSVLLRKLKPDGCLHLIVPDLIFHAKQLMDGRDTTWAMAGFYGWMPVNGMQHLWGYTRASLRKLLIDCGASRVENIAGKPSDIEVKAWRES